MVTGTVLILPRGVCLCVYMYVCMYVYILYILYLYLSIYILYILYLYLSIYLSIYLYRLLQLLPSLSNNCHWALIIDITISELFKSTLHHFHFYNG